MKVKFKYIGRGAFFSGVPARDLSEAEWAGLTEEQQEAVKASSLYQKVGADPIKSTRAGTSPAPTEEQEGSNGG